MPRIRYHLYISYYSYAYGQSLKNDSLVFDCKFLLFYDENHCNSFFEYFKGGGLLAAHKAKSISKSNPIFFKKINQAIDEGSFDHLDEMKKMTLFEKVESEYFKFLGIGKNSKKSQTLALKELQ